MLLNSTSRVLVLADGIMRICIVCVSNQKTNLLCNENTLVIINHYRLLHLHKIAQCNIYIFIKVSRPYLEAISKNKKTIKLFTYWHFTK